MRIAIVYNTFYYVAKFRLPLIKELLKSGHSIVVIAPSDEFMPIVQAAGAQTVEIPKMGSKTEIATNLLPIIRAIHAALRGNQVEIVFPYTIFPNILLPWICRLLKIRSYPNVAGLGSMIIGNSSLSGTIMKWAYGKSISHATGVFFQNPDDMADLKMSDNPKAVLLPGSGVDLDRFHPSLVNVSTYYTGDIKIFFIGRLLKQKGILDFIELASRTLSANEIPDQVKARIRFLIVGEMSDDEREVNGLLEKAGKSKMVDYLGAVNPAAMQDIYSQARFLVLPTQYGEGIPRTILEASASGVPCIAYNWRGVKRAVNDAITGWLCPAGNVDALAEALSRALDMEHDEYLAMCDEARRLMISSFSESIVLQRYKNVIG